jgi:hypothetical protein
MGLCRRTAFLVSTGNGIYSFGARFIVAARTVMCGRRRGRVYRTCALAATAKIKIPKPIIGAQFAGGYPILNTAVDSDEPPASRGHRRPDLDLGRLDQKFASGSYVMEAAQIKEFAAQEVYFWAASNLGNSVNEAQNHDEQTNRDRASPFGREPR